MTNLEIYNIKWRYVESYVCTLSLGLLVRYKYVDAQHQYFNTIRLPFSVKLKKNVKVAISKTNVQYEITSL